jgi:hypothetical protein
MGFDLGRIALGTVRFALILDVSEGFLLFGVNRNRWLRGPLKGTNPFSNVLELSITIGVLFALHCFAIGLQTIALRAEQQIHLGTTDDKSLAVQFSGKRPGAFACPS